jgi:hypothetical protein
VDIQQMMKRLLARMDLADAKAAARQERMLAFLEGLRSCGKETSACQVASEACPEKLKAGPRRNGAAVITFEERLDKTEAANKDTPLCPCTAKRKYSQGAGKGQFSNSNTIRANACEEMKTDALGMQ